MSYTVEVTFQAQEKTDDRAGQIVRADRDPNRATFELPLEEVVDVPVEDLPEDHTEAAALLPDDDSYESDWLAEHEAAPDWVNDWVENAKGPFYVQTELVA